MNRGFSRREFVPGLQVSVTTKRFLSLAERLPFSPTRWRPSLRVLSPRSQPAHRGSLYYSLAPAMSTIRSEFLARNTAARPETTIVYFAGEAFSEAFFFFCENSLAIKTLTRETPTTNTSSLYVKNSAKYRKCRFCDVDECS